MSEQKLEALVGHLFVVEGRVLRATPPGTRIELPPRRAPRAREEETLFVLITAAGRKKMPANMFDTLATAATEAYFKSRVGVTGALRDALVAINDQLYGTAFRAGALCLAKRREDVYIARSGTTLSVMRSPDSYETFPGDPDLLNILPLGSRSEPMMEFTRFPLGPGNVYVLGDAGFAGLSDKMLRACIGQGEVEQILDQLETVVTKDATATVIQFVTPDMAAEVAPSASQPASAPTTPPVDEASSEPLSVPRTAFNRPANASQPQPAEVDVLVEERPAEASPEAPSESTPTRMQPPVGPPEMPIEEAVKAGVPVEEAPPGMETPPAEDAPPAPAEPEAEPPAEAVATAADAPARPRRPRTTQTVSPEAEATNTARRLPGSKGLARVLGFVGRGLNAALNRLLPEPETEHERHERETIPLNLVAMIAILIPAIIAVVVVGFSISEQGTTRFERLRGEALVAYQEAQEYSQAEAADRKTAREMWDISRGHAAAALAESPEDSELRDILRESLLKLDFYDRVRRVEIKKLRDFGENADLRGPVVAANAVDIYTLDRNRGAVYHNTLNSAGDEIIGTADFPVIERGQRAGEHTIANLIDIMWMDEGGAAQRNALVALDENGLLISYSPTFPPAQSLKLVLPPSWNRPAAIAQWGTNFYVLDAGADQIWRYVRYEGYYTQQPEEYFTGAERPDLAGAVNMAIDEQGAIYVLFEDGEIRKYLAGEPTSFSLFEGPVGGLEETYTLFVDNDPVSYALYVGDRDNEALYQISLGGRVNDGYRPSTSPLDAFADISGVFVNSSTGRIKIYVLSGESLYYFLGN